MNDSGIQRLLDYGAEFTGASAGVASEFLGIVPAGYGGALSAVVTCVIKEFGGRALSPRQETRIGAVTIIAINRISAGLVSGRNLRTDEFTNPRQNFKSPSEEIFEGVLLKARDQFEEKKLQYLGNFYANLAFTEGVSAESAHLLLKQFDRMSFRQLCLISIVGQKGTYDVEALRKPTHSNHELEALKREEMDLHANDLGNLGLLSGEGPWIDKLSALGKVFYELTALNELESEEKLKIENTIEVLRKE